MDFDSCFNDCCKGCHSTSKYRSPASGQGDCKCGVEIQEKNFWVKGKKLRSKREKEKAELKRENQKKLMDVTCSCCTKSNKKQECKLKHEAKQEQDEPAIFENCNSTWNNFIADSWKSRMERFYVSEERKCSECSTSERLLTENVLELEEKVNFLLRIFKDCGCSRESYVENVAAKAAGTFGDAWHLLNLDKRLSAAEEGIEKLALILEELVKESSKKKAFLAAEDTTHSEPAGFDKTTMGERINFLKNRNDMLLSLIKTFLKSSSVEEICSRLSSEPNEYGSEPLSPKLNFGGKTPSKDFSREEIVETLKNLQVSDTQPQKKAQKYNDQPHVRVAKREHGLKYPANKLEVISEQAELALSQSDETESVISDFHRKNGVRNLKGKYSQVSENNAETALELCEVTSRLLAQEAMLKSSLDKVHLELLSKLDAPEKTFLKSNILNSIQMPAKEENNSCDFEGIFGSSSDSSCVFCENENMNEPSSNEPPHTASKCTRYDDCKEPPIEEERNSLGSNPNSSTKDSSSKKTDKQFTPKNKFNPKTPQLNGCTTSRGSPKANRNRQCLTELGPGSRGGGMNEGQGREQRPLTAPTSLRKASPTPPQKSFGQEKNATKNSGINSNVRNKNKVLLSKKSFVQTS